MRELIGLTLLWIALLIIGEKPPRRQPTGYLHDDARGWVPYA